MITRTMKNSVSEQNSGGFFPERLLITDLDGTLMRSDGTIAEKDRAALLRLKARNIATAVATGRSLYSFSRSQGADLPLDYVIFSTGAGIVRHADGCILRKVNLPPDTVAEALTFFWDSPFDFMLHAPVPDNHHFFFRRTHQLNPDFDARIALYQSFARPLDGREGPPSRPAAQFLTVVAREEARDALAFIRSSLPNMSIVHSTSPLDRKSVWIELFHPTVSKSQAAAWLAAELSVLVGNTAAIGNDFNDLDLLQWTSCAYVVHNAHPDLKRQFKTVAANDHGGFAEAVDHWLGGQ